MNMQRDIAKNAASKRALDFVKEGMQIGLGTGSTAAFFIEHLIELCKKGFEIEAVATSLASEEMARNGGIKIIDPQFVNKLDLTIDGADEIDPQKRLIKGAGGALVREKIIANMSSEMIVIADQSKRVDKLGNRPLPIEVIPFGANATKSQLESIGFSGTFRMSDKEMRYITDNGNWILDIELPTSFGSPEKAHLEIIQNPGVVDTGFFFNLAKCVIIGNDDGTTLIIE